MQRREQGSALVIALVIVAIATVLATAMMWRTHLDQRRVEVQLYGQQARQYLLGAESWTKSLLLDDKQEVDHLQEPWAQQAIVLPVDGGYIEGRLSDLQGKFNINNLVIDADSNGSRENSETGTPGTPGNRNQWLEDYKRLLDLLGLDPVIAASTMDWLDRDIEPTGFEGAEDDFYLGQAPPYRTANQQIQSISELRLVKGMTPEQFARLEPFITALPVRTEATRININTASAEVLAAIGEKITPGDAADIMQMREQTPFTNTQDIDANLPNNLFGDSRDHVGVNTSYFLLRGTSGVGSVEITLYSVLRREEGTMATVRRAQGTL